MKVPKVVQVFEYETLRVGTGGFTPHHFDLMAAYLEGRREQFFQIGHRCIRFTNYVGVIQVQDLVIEVLPKTGKVSDKELWRNVLIGMLKASGFLNISSTSDAYLKLQTGTLLDLYYQVFLERCRNIISEGLFRQYTQKTSNRTALKGRLLFQDQVKRNLVRKERFVTSAQDYTKDNIFNQILLKALAILRAVSGNTAHRRYTTMLLHEFEGISDRYFNRASFERLRYDRTTERYRTATWIAELIILNYLPDVRGGNRSALAIMFPMEALFEAYVATALKNASRGTGFRVETQRVQRFWRPEDGRSRTLRSDIVIDWADDSGKRRIVLDTKRKVPSDKAPADGDLKQMFVYNKYFGAESSNLLYPTTGSSQPVNGLFLGDRNGGCSMWYAPILDSDQAQLNQDLGSQLLRSLESSTVNIESVGTTRTAAP